MGQDGKETQTEVMQPQGRRVRRDMEAAGRRVDEMTQAYDNPDFVEEFVK